MSAADEETPSAPLAATAAMTARLIEAGVPRRIAGFRPGDSGSPAWSRAYAGLREGIGTGLLCCLCGGRGTGKSALASCLAGRALESGRHAKFVDAATLFMNLRATLGDKAAETEAEMIRRYVHPDLLVIDDLTMPPQADFEHRATEHIIMKRFDAADRDTLLVTTAPAAGLSAALGPGIAARLESAGSVVACDWGSLRVRRQDIGLGGRA